MTATTILLLRHADVHNPELLFYGRSPRFRISELGIEQARFLAGMLSDEPLAAIYSSPMLRARQTAAIVAERHPEAHRHRVAALNEVRTGWKGAPPRSLPARINLYEPPHSPGDETIADIWRRMERFLWRLARRHGGETVACVSHGDPIVITHAALRGLPLCLDSIRGDFYPQKCSVTRVTLAQGRPIAVSYRDVIGESAPELRAPH
ncbi:MAG: histidine phosphatase family protein [Chloroflexi bacterium]|nr:histidine phosphatase family protein [Chloroflexota bacterium]